MLMSACRAKGLSCSLSVFQAVCLFSSLFLGLSASPVVYSFVPFRLIAIKLSSFFSYLLVQFLEIHKSLSVCTEGYNTTLTDNESELRMMQLHVSKYSSSRRMGLHYHQTPVRS